MTAYTPIYIMCTSIYTQVIAPAGSCGDDAAHNSIYGVTIGHGKLAKGAVVGLIQLLACNYGEVCV
jgi:hypothetical protein